MKNILSTRKSIIILFGLILLSFSYSCSKEHLNDNKGNLTEIKLKAIKVTGEDANAATKTTLNGYVTSWVVAADKIGIYSPQARTQTGGAGDPIVNAQFSAESSGISSTFNGTMYWGSANSSHTFYSYYPYAPGNATSTLVPITLSANQTQLSGNNSDHIGYLDFMIATPKIVVSPNSTAQIGNNEVSLRYNHIFSILEFLVINGGDISKIKLSGNGSLSLYSGTIDITQTTPANSSTTYSISSPTYGSDITLALTNPVSTTADYNTTPKIYMMVLPKSITGYLDIAIKNGDTYKFIQKEAPTGGFNRGLKYVVQLDAANLRDYPGTSLAAVTIGTTTWAPVNAGYINTVRPYGLLYQWGRKYGQEFVNTSVITGPVVIGIGNNPTNVSNFYENSVAATFYDWCTPQAASWDMALYNPCPKGWRVPTTVELTALNNSGSTWVNAAEGNPDGLAGRWFGGLHSSTHVGSVFLPAAGYRTSNLGERANRGVAGQYWSSVISGTDASYLNFRSGYNFISTFYRAHGYSVRCVLE